MRFLRGAKQRRDLAIEDFRDAFGVTHEAAALRLMNLATVHLGFPLHFLRVRDDGAILKAYENDGLPLPSDVSGSVEGQLVHPAWAARAAFERTNRTTEFYQFTDTPAGTYWCSTQTGDVRDGGVLHNGRRAVRGLEVVPRARHGGQGGCAANARAAG